MPSTWHHIVAIPIDFRINKIIWRKIIYGIVSWQQRALLIDNCQIFHSKHGHIFDMVCTIELTKN